MSLIDSHCHLDFPVFDEDRQGIIAECRQKGIVQFIVPGVSVDTWPRLKAVAESFIEIFPAYGVHPCFIDNHVGTRVNGNVGEAVGSIADSLVEFLGVNLSIAVGEIGLDYFANGQNAAKQNVIFNAQLTIARQFDLPVILHVRKAHDDAIMALRHHKVKGGVVHAFNGSLVQAQQYIDLGFKLGFGGAMISQRALHLRKLAKQLPLDVLVLETDSPDMRPANFLSSRNTPLTVLSVLNELSIIRDESADDIANVTSKNVMNVFGLSQRACVFNSKTIKTESR